MRTAVAPLHADVYAADVLTEMFMAAYPDTLMHESIAARGRARAQFTLVLRFMLKLLLKLLLRLLRSRAQVTRAGIALDLLLANRRAELQHGAGPPVWGRYARDFP